MAFGQRLSLINTLDNYRHELDNRISKVKIVNVRDIPNVWPNAFSGVRDIPKFSLPYIHSQELEACCSCS